MSQKDLSKKRKFADRPSRPKKRTRIQKEYHSSSEDDEPDFAPVDLEGSDDEIPAAQEGQSPGRSLEGSDASGDTEPDSETENLNISAANRTKKSMTKRNDPEAFTTSITKILSTKQSQNARKDPILARSKDAVQTSNEIANDRLEKRAKAKLRADRKKELDHGRVEDVLGVTTGDASGTAAEENRLRKTAQRGVIRLFNAFRAAQIKADLAAKEARSQGTVGYQNREEKITEVSKQGFLDLINPKKGTTVEKT